MKFESVKTKGVLYISSKNFVKTSQFNIPWNLNCMKFDWGVVRTRKLVIFRIILINWNWNYHKKEVDRRNARALTHSETRRIDEVTLPVRY